MPSVHHITQDAAMPLDWSQETPETRRAALAAAEAERRDVERETGCTFGPDGKLVIPVNVSVRPLKPFDLTRDRKAQLFGILDALTQNYGFSTEQIRLACDYLDAGK